MQKATTGQYVISGLSSIIISHYLTKAFPIDRTTQPVLREIVYFVIFAAFFFGVLYGQLWLKKRQKK